MKFYLIFTFTIVFLHSCSNNRAGKIDHIYNSLLDSLKQNDTLFIFFESSGCEHYMLEKIKIYRQANKLMGSLKLKIPNYDKDIAMLTNELADSAIIAYEQFEHNGPNIKSTAQCTTVDLYKIKLNNTIIDFDDIGCAFNDYYILKEKMFGQKTIENFYNKIYN